MLLHVVVVHSLSSLYSVQLSEYTMSYFYFLLLIDITDCSKYFSMLLLTLIYMSLGVYVQDFFRSAVLTV